MTNQTRKDPGDQVTWPERYTLVLVSLVGYILGGLIVKQFCSAEDPARDDAAGEYRDNGCESELGRAAEDALSLRLGLLGGDTRTDLGNHDAPLTCQPDIVNVGHTAHFRGDNSLHEIDVYQALDAPDLPDWVFGSDQILDIPFADFEQRPFLLLVEIDHSAPLPLLLGSQLIIGPDL